MWTFLHENEIDDVYIDAMLLSIISIIKHFDINIIDFRLL